MKLKSAYYSVEFLQMERVFEEVRNLLEDNKIDNVLSILYKVSDKLEKNFLRKMSEENTLNFMVVDTGIVIENKNNLRR